MADEQRAIGPGLGSGDPQRPSGRRATDPPQHQSTGLPESADDEAAERLSDPGYVPPPRSQDFPRQTAEPAADGSAASPSQQYSGTVADESLKQHAWRAPVNEWASADQADSAAAAQRIDEARADAAPVSSTLTGPYADEAKIGLWGSTGSGKTTFLAALRLAAGADRANGQWAIHPCNVPSAELLVRLTRELVSLRKFPQATAIGAYTDLAWLFMRAETEPPRSLARQLRRRRRPGGSSFTLNLVDVSGEAFGESPESVSMPLHIIRKALDHLAEAQGLLYLFDPINERDNRDSADYFNRTIIELSRRMVEERRLIGQYLPHQVSVCITKFDHPEVFQHARKANLVNYGPDGVPRVLEEDAEAFFEVLCDGSFWANRDEQTYASAQFVLNELRTRFHPDRIRYFVSSSIGFRRPPRWDPEAALRPDSRFDPENFANIVTNGEHARIQDAINPINVLEPLISLQQRISRNARGRA